MVSGAVRCWTPICWVIWGRNLSAWPRPDFRDRNHGRPSIIDGRSIQLASRCIIGKVDGQGDGKAILCARGCYPDEAGAALLGRYSEEPLIDELIALGQLRGWKPNRRNARPTTGIAAILENTADPTRSRAEPKHSSANTGDLAPSGCTSGLPTVGWRVRRWRGSRRRAILKTAAASATHHGLNVSRTREAQRARPLYSVVADFQRSS